MSRGKPSRALLAVLLIGLAGAGCRGKSQESESPPSGGLAGSPQIHVALADAITPDVFVLPPGLDLATPLVPDAAPIPPPVASDAAPPPPPPPPPPPTPDAAATVARPDARADARLQLDAAPEPTPRDDAGTRLRDSGDPDKTIVTVVIDAAAARDAGRDTAPVTVVIDAGAAARDAARDTAPITIVIDAGAPARDAATVVMPEAGSSGPESQAAARTFASQQSNIQRCAEAEGPGELRVQVRVRGSDGRVRDVTLSSAYTDSAEQCARNLIATLRFPTSAVESATFDYTYVITDIPTTTLGPGATPEQQLEAEESRLRRQAKRCIVGVEGAVTVTVSVSADTGTATLQRVDGAVTAEQQQCLSGVVRSANLPDIAAGGEFSLRVQ